MYNNKRHLVKQFHTNSKKSVGTVCTCPSCGGQFIKQHYSQFCCTHINDECFNHFYKIVFDEDKKKV